MNNQSSGPRDDVDPGRPIGGHGLMERPGPYSYLPGCDNRLEKDHREGLVVFIRQLGEGRVYNLNSQSISLFLGRREKRARITCGQEQLSPH